MIKVIQTGFYSTIQDLGRIGSQDLGVPLSGAMDLYAAQLANRIIGNSDDAAVLEITMTGPRLEFTSPTFICISGANMTPMLNNTQIKLNVLTKIVKGDVLSFGKLIHGFRSYLAVFGGFQSEMILNSRSMYPNLTKKVKLSKKEELQILDIEKEVKSFNASLKVQSITVSDETLNVFKGPEYNQLSDAQKDELTTKLFSISKYNNRMAYQLNEQVEYAFPSIITSLVMPGTLQLTPSGQLIILMRDCQTTGGYPRIFQLDDSSINKLAQKSTSEKIRFNVID